MSGSNEIDSAVATVLGVGEPSRAFAWHRGEVISLARFRDAVVAIASSLPSEGSMINLCEDRYSFVAAYAAALSRGQRVLLPPSRVERVVEEVQSANAGSYRIDDAFVEQAAQNAIGNAPIPQVMLDTIAMVAYTSGSTGSPQPNAKRWRGLRQSSARNAYAMRSMMGSSAQEVLWLVATVPPQHMYGMELSVLLPLLEGMALHSARPLFPADIARALAEVPAPRVLVSTPVHLRAIVDSPQVFPEIALVVSATAPLDKALAQAVEDKLQAPFLEMFGSTETCVFASRRPVFEERWRHYEGVSLAPSQSNTRVSAAWFDDAVVLQDVVELFGADEFVVRGRNADMIEVAGKRASLADLTRRVLAIDGVEDAVVFQPEQVEPGRVRRVAAAVVAPTLNAHQVMEELAKSVDAAFLPRPLVLVKALPRNEMGKLPRAQLMELLKGSGAVGSN